MLLENFTATLNKLMCYNKITKSISIHFWCILLRFFLKKQGQSSNIRHQQPPYQLSKFSTYYPR